MDMTDEQRKAARKALAVFPGVKVNIHRGDMQADLTPYLESDPSQTGAPVTVVYGATAAALITKELTASCRVLVE